MAKKTLIISIAAIIILGLPFFYYLVSRTGQTDKAGQLTDELSRLDQDQFSKKSAEKLRETLFPEETKAVIEKFKKSRFDETNIDIPIKNEDEPKPPAQISEKTQTNGGQTTSETNIASQISDAEIFNSVYPPEYLKDLSSVQDRLINNNIIKGAERIELNSETALVSFSLKILDYLVAQGHVSPEDQSSLTDFWTRDYLEMKRNEYNEIKSSGKLNSALNWYRYPKVDYPPYLALAHAAGLTGIIKTMAHIFANKIADAGWFTTPDCYKDNNPEYLVEGFTVVTGCCNCGVIIYECGDACCASFIPDCGPNGYTCAVASNCANYIPLGCLNASWACGNWPNAIWDGPPGAVQPITAICGCG